MIALEAKHRDIDNEVSLKVAEIAAQNGVAPVETPVNGGNEESLEDLAKRIDEAQGVEKAKLKHRDNALKTRALKPLLSM